MYEETVTSIQVRAGDQQRVIDALGRVLGRLGLRRYELARGEGFDHAVGIDAALGGPEGQRMFLLSGAGTGWVGVYGDIDRDLAEELSRETGMPAFWVHCDDGLVLRYIYWEEGLVRDGWSSCPSYHEEVLYSGDGTAGDAEVIAGALGVEGATSSESRLAEVAEAEAAARRPGLVARARRRLQGRAPLDAGDEPRKKRAPLDADAKKKDADAKQKDADAKKDGDDAADAKKEDAAEGDAKAEDAKKDETPEKKTPAPRAPTDAGVVERVRGVLERIAVADIESLGEIDEADGEEGAGQSAFSGLAELAKIFRWPAATVSFEELLSGGVLEQPGGGAFALAKFRPRRADEKILGTLGWGD